ncbi:MAG: CapA family protein [Lachnospiraceae bacterium]|nr:CapA family protein [Lachnospiraceae bacterium]
MKRNSSIIRLVVLTCLFLVCFGAILWYMREQKLADTDNPTLPTVTPTTVLPAEASPTPTTVPTTGNDAPENTPTPTPDTNTPTNTPIPTPDTEIPTDAPTPTPITETPVDTPTVTPIPIPGTDADVTPAPDADTVTLCLTGDLMCLAGQQFATELADGSHDYSGSFALIQDYLQSCDFAIGNLETLLSESNPYTTAAKEVNGSPNCNAPADYLASLKAAGFTSLVTANNHSLDGGKTGIDETLQHLDEYGFCHTGTYASNDTTTERFILLEKNGITIGLVAFTELINQRDSLPVSELEQVINCYSEEFAAEVIAAARAAGADFIIAYNHWGSENTHEVRSYQRTHAQALADAGADLIIGSHPHCLQELESLEAADGRSVPCFYSLGNLVSSMARDINNDTVLLTVTLHRNEDIVAAESMDILPCHVFGYLNGKPHVIVPNTHSFERADQQTELQEAEARIADILKLPQ